MAPPLPRPIPPPQADAESGATADAEAVARRLDAVRTAVGSVRLAGLAPDAATVADVKRAARGELTFEAACAALFAQSAAERRTGGPR